jgi:PadR family transcriptional regulator, regulatory protein PadR
MFKKSKLLRANTSYLGEFEQLVLLAILRLGDEAYGMKIRQELGAAGRSASLGAVYITLERLEEKTYLSSKVGDPTPERGGRGKKYFQVEGSGLMALRHSIKTTTKLCNGLGQLLGGTR